MTDEKNKPQLDEQTFSKLLEAAYVLQEHNREIQQMQQSLELHSEQLRQQELQEAETQAALLRSAKRSSEENARPNPEYTLTLAEIVEAQHQIQIRHLESDEAMAVVAERITRITNASGAGIGILEGKTIRYRAGAGVSALPVGSEAPLESAICAVCVRTGQVLRTPDVNTEFLFDPELCRVREIQSLVAVPVYHDGNIVGALELYFDRPSGFAEQDIHTCQLMAGLVTEAIGRAAGSELRKSVAAERSSLQAQMEQLRPSHAAAVESQSREGFGDVAGKTAVVSAGESFECWKCGSKIIAEEQFCGKCGAPRVGEADDSTQRKVASALQMRHGNLTAFSPANGTAHLAMDDAEETSADSRAEASALSLSAAQEQDSIISTSAYSSRSVSRPSGESEVEPTELVADTPTDLTWSSAANARDYLEALAEPRSTSALARFWHARRGDFYLVVAVVLVLVVIRWGILSNPSVGAAGNVSTVSGGRRKLPANADLSMFDKLLISLGLADPPDPPEYKGNPNTQVWIDTRTALYYCSSSDLYGKTPKGRFASQHDAQSDQFEPASRKACD